ncbi:ankyrin repeat domain-containing protein [Leptospira sp. 201903074]|uniref:ankyrin repeat domain-containing protein n=1 Tax=Leptospira abararensis TaxID=2810036 RepID=UPI0019641270|nr:ankyrin repeat domain-containing protein [Leptospira abararensis]
MNRKVSKTLNYGGIILVMSMLTGISCSSLELRCSGCTLSEAYVDANALELVNAAVKGNSKKVEELVRKGANPNHLENGKVPMLLWTLCAENQEGFEALLKAGADPNLDGTGHGIGDGQSFGSGMFGFRWRGYRFVTTSKIKEGWSATVMAAALRKPEFLHLALKNGGDLNAKKGDGGDSRPLLIASRYANLENIKILLEAGANINIHDEKYAVTSAPELAIAGYSRFDIAIWFLEQGYNHDLQGLGRLAEASNVHDGLQPDKDKLMDMLTKRGVRFPIPGRFIDRGLKTRQIPANEVDDVIRGKKSIWSYPKRPGMENVDP